MEGSFLPPCSSVLQQKMNRTNHIAGILLSVKLITADESNVVDDDENGKVYFYFF